MGVPDYILAAVERLPPLNITAAEIIALAQDREHDIKDLARIVAADPILSGQLLRIVNSAAFGLNQRIDNVERAIAYLGERLLIAAAFMNAVGDLCKRPLLGYAAEAMELWRHSLCAAIGGRLLAAYASKAVSPSTAYTAGLLHDIGKIVLSDFLKEHVKDAVELFEQGRALDYLESERFFSGADHSETGEALAARWNLPTNIRQAIRWHHDPNKAESASGLVWTTHAADFVAMMTGCSTGADAFRYRLQTEYEKHLRVSKPVLERLTVEINAELEETIAAFKEIGKGL